MLTGKEGHQTLGSHMGTRQSSHCPGVPRTPGLEYKMRWVESAVERACASQKPRLKTTQGGYAPPKAEFKTEILIQASP